MNTRLKQRLLYAAVFTLHSVASVVVAFILACLVNANAGVLWLMFIVLSFAAGYISGLLGEK